MARLLASGFLCSEDMFGCAGEDEGLLKVLASCSTPDAAGWKEIALHNWRRRWRAYGTTPSGERVAVEVLSTERYELTRTHATRRQR